MMTVKTVEAGEALIKAAGLLKTALKENNASFDFSLEDCLIYYVPLMPRSHRSMWFEEMLYLFLRSTEEIAEDSLRCVSDSHRGIRLLPCPEDTIQGLETEVEYNLRLEVGSLKKIPPFAYQNLMPHYYQLDPKDLTKTMNLLAFA
jgi:hypothetical protein